MKKILSFLLCFALVFCCVPAIDVSAEEGWSLAQMQASFPDGKHWNHYTGAGHGYDSRYGWIHYGNNCGTFDQMIFSVSDTPCYPYGVAPAGYYDCNTYYNKAVQCQGFSYLLADLAYPGATDVMTWGSTSNKNTAVSIVKPGDVIHYTGLGADLTYGHWVFVIAVSGSTVTVGESNVGSCCKIRWGAQLNIYSMSTMTLYSAPYQWNPYPVSNFNLDLNAKVDGEDKGVLDGVATADVYINGTLVADDVSDYYQSHKKGTTYEIKDIKTTGCYVLTGVDSFSGTLNENTDCRFTFETKHTFDDGVITTPPSCTEKGVKTVSCVNCDYKTTSEVDSLGHDYSETRIPPDCTENAKYLSICSRCNDSTVRPVTDEDIWSEWSIEKPDADESKIQSKTQYRYMQSETMLSPDPALVGWVQTGKGWSEGKTETVYYVDSFPAGFDTNHYIYNAYKNIPAAKETETKKVTLGTPVVAGYLYWHWCSSYYNGSYPINRLVSDCYTGWDSASGRPYDIFHAFFSESYVAPSSSGAVNITYPDICCQTYWWLSAIPVYAVNVTTQEMIYEHTRETDWGEWTDNAFSVTDNAKFETRTLYRYSDSTDLATGHEWDNGVVTGDVKTYTCKNCSETKTEAYTKPDFIKGDVNGDGKVNAVDARLVLRTGAQLQTLEGSAALAADVNEDGKINAIDARKILRVGAQLETF